MNSNSQLSETEQLAAIRQQIRKTRLQLSGVDKTQKDQQIRAHIKNHLSARNEANTSSIIALYLAFDGEPDLKPIAHWLRGQSFKLALPVIDPTKLGKMEFHLWDIDSQLQHNRFGIPEPVTGAILSPEDITLALTPLVAFDASGVRLGVGGGYYDRYFQASNKRPHLLGVAYECQRLDKLPRRDWDIPLDAVITEKGRFSCPDIAQ